MNRRAVITGIGIISPNGIGKKAFWDALRNGRPGIKKVSSFDASGFPCQIAGEVSDFNPLDYMEKKEAKRMVRISQFAVAAARMAIADAGFKNGLPSSGRCCITLGVTTGTAIDQFEKEYRAFLKEGPEAVSPFGVAIASPNAGVSEIANSLNVPTIQKNFSNDCTSGVDALGFTAEKIKNGEISLAICGGVECPITPLLLALFCRSGLVPAWKGKPEEASRPFDLKRCGGILSEGAAVFIMEEMEAAKRRGAKIYGEIVGHGSSGVQGYVSYKGLEEIARMRDQCGSNSFKGNGVVDAMEQAILDARVSPEVVDYISAHAPSDPHIDAVESQAIKDYFGERAYRIPISSIKSMIGSSMTAAGVLQVASVLFAFEEDLIPPTINYQYPDPDCDLDYVPNSARFNQIEFALVNSHGLGGGNSSLLLKNVKNV